jgi:hypothetical protein
MKFILWFIKNSLFHLLVLLAMLIIAISWESGIDKTVAIYMTSVILLVLVVGKLYYYRKNVNTN